MQIVQNSMPLRSIFSWCHRVLVGLCAFRCAVRCDRQLACLHIQTKWVILNWHGGSTRHRSTACLHIQTNYIFEPTRMHVLQYLVVIIIIYNLSLCFLLFFCLGILEKWLGTLLARRWLLFRQFLALGAKSHNLNSEDKHFCCLNRLHCSLTLSTVGRGIGQRRASLSRYFCDRAYEGVASKQSLITSE